MEPYLILIIVISALVVGGLIAYIIFCFGISSMMANKMCLPKHFKTTEEKQLEMSQIKDLDGKDEYQRTPIAFTMKDGYVIHGDYSLNNPKKWAICLHGHISNRQGLIKYSYSFYRLGYSLLFYDHRSHGENERGYVTMGYKEHLDALEIIEQLKNKFGQDIEAGLFGCSMGGATALMCTKENQDLAFVVSDCGFASLKQLTRGFIKKHKSPYFPILQITEWYIKRRYHFSYDDSSAEKAVRFNKRVPILFIHGDKDELVYLENAKILYNNCNGPKQLEIFEGASHCGSILVDKNRYYNVIEQFINEHVR